jgi:hypothetical protein
MKTFNALRTLARSAKWQIIYARSKETSGIQLFTNVTDLSAIQVSFLQWLEIYHSLETDLAMKEKFISRDVIENDVRCDAYLYCRSMFKNNDKLTPKAGYELPPETPSMVFKRGR